jgi:LPXTG-motif cell wall-anchored protein
MLIRPLALVIAALVAFPAAAVAQDPAQTDTTPLGDYTQTTPTSTVQTEPAEEEPEQEPAAQEESGGPAPAPAPAPSAPAPQPQALAYTGFEALAVGILGVALLGGAVALQRRRRTS